MLRDLQKQFLHGIYSKDTAILDAIRPGRLSAAQQLDIYKGSIFASLSDTLAAIYPVTCSLVGDTFFQAMCQHYIQQTPSLSPDLDEYGVDFDRFIAGFKATQSLVYLADMACLEWAWHRAFYTSHDQHKNIHSLLSLPPGSLPQARLHLAPGSYLIRSNYPIFKIWRAHQHNCANDAGNISLADGADHLLIWRDALNMRMDVLDATVWDFLQLSEQSDCLATLQRRYSKIYDEMTFVNALNRAIESGYFYYFEPPAKADTAKTDND